MKPGAILVILLVFMAVAITVTTAATLLTLSSSRTASSQDVSFGAYTVAESGLEEALIRILRDPTYTGGTLTVGAGVATITVASGSGTFVVTSTGNVDLFSRTVQAQITDSGGLLTIASWREIYP